jgi:glycerol uptake facilitator protein
VNEFVGELAGTATLVLLGDGVVAGVLLGRSKAANAGWLAITTGWALAVFAGVFVAKAAGSPGGYINPVGPLVEFVNGKMPADRAALLAAGEVAGAFLGAVLVWLHYLPHWEATPDPAAKLGVFCTAPAIRALPANFAAGSGVASQWGR